MGTPSGEGPAPGRARPAGHPPVEHLSAVVREVGPPDEREGPLAVHRFVKEDGRSLILYERVEEFEG